MRCISIPLLLVAACAACGPCLAQDAQGQSQPESQALQSPQQAQPRSAFGKVMAVMISSLQRQAHERGHPRAAVRTSDAGTPLGIEVGDAFRMGMDDATAPTSAQATSAQATGTGGAAADDVPRAAPPEPSSLPPASDYAVRQPALAGPG